MTIGERKGPPQGVIQNCETQERNPCAPKLEDGTQEETLQQERRPLSEAWDLAKNVHKLNDLDKATFFSPSEVWSLPAPSSSKKISSSAELDTLRKSRKPTAVITANGEVQTSEEAQVHDHDLDLFVTVQIPEVTAAVLSLGKLCEEHGYSYEWTSGHKPQQTKHGRKIQCNTRVIDKFFQFDCKYISHIVTARHIRWYIGESSNNTKWIPASRNRLRDLPEWSEEFTENQEDKGLLASRGTPANNSQDEDSERPTKVVSRKHSIYTHFSKRPKVRNLQENQD